MNQAPKKNQGASKQSIDIPFVVAKHVILYNGTIVEWPDVEALIAAQPNPKLVTPHFYFTTGLIESGSQEAAKKRIIDLDLKFKFNEYIETPLDARPSFQYDKIRTKADLIPDNSLRIDGTVFDSHGKPVGGAEVLLVTPVDQSIAKKAIDIYLVQGHLRNRLLEVVTDTDAAGRFALYPPPNTPYYVVALHKDGFGLAQRQLREIRSHRASNVGAY